MKITIAVIALLLVQAATTPKAELPKPLPQIASPTPAMPRLSDVERLKIENLQLKFSILQRQQSDLQAEYSAVVQGLNAEHPGFVFDAQTNQFVPVPEKK